MNKRMHKSEKKKRLQLDKLLEGQDVEQEMKGLLDKVKNKRKLERQLKEQEEAEQEQEKEEVEMIKPRHGLTEEKKLAE